MLVAVAVTVTELRALGALAVVGEQVPQRQELLALLTLVVEVAAVQSKGLAVMAAAAS